MIGSTDEVRVGLVTSDESVLDLTEKGVRVMQQLLERNDLVEELARLRQQNPVVVV